MMVIRAALAVALAVGALAMASGLAAKRLELLKEAVPWE